MSRACTRSARQFSFSFFLIYFHNEDFSKESRLAEISPRASECKWQTRPCYASMTRNSWFGWLGKTLPLSTHAHTLSPTPTHSSTPTSPQPLPSTHTLRRGPRRGEKTHIEKGFASGNLRPMNPEKIIGLNTKLELLPCEGDFPASSAPFFDFWSVWKLDVNLGLYAYQLFWNGYLHASEFIYFRSPK